MQIGSTPWRPASFEPAQHSAPIPWQAPGALAGSTPANPSHPSYQPVKNPNEPDDPGLPSEFQDATLPETRLPPPDPATFDSSQAYTDFMLKQAQHSKAKKQALEEPFERKTMTPEKNPVEWGQYSVARWDAYRDQANVEQAIAAQLRAAAQQEADDPNAVDDAAHHIAMRYQGDVQAQTWLNNARETVKTESPQQRGTSIQLYETNRAQGKFLAWQAKQNEALEGAPQGPTVFDQPLKDAQAALQTQRQELLTALGPELDEELKALIQKRPAEHKNGPPTTEEFGTAMREVSKRHGTDSEINAALQADYTVRQAMLAAENGQPHPLMQMKKLGFSFNVTQDPVIRTMIGSDARTDMIISDYRQWATGEIGNAGDIRAQLAKLRELTDPQTSSPFEAETLVTAPEVQKLVKQAAQEVYDDEEAFRDISAAVDSALRNAKLPGGPLPGDSKPDDPKNSPPSAGGLPGAPDNAPATDLPAWFKEVASAMTHDADTADYLRFSMGHGGGAFLPLEMARQLEAKGESGRARGIVHKVNEIHDEIETELQEPVEQFFELAQKVIGPPSEWQPLLTAARQKQANENWGKHEDFAKESDGKLKQIQEDPRAYAYLRSLQGVAYYKEQGTFAGLLKHDKNDKGEDPLTAQLTQFNEDRNLQFAVGTNQLTTNEVFRVYEDAKRNSGMLDPALFTHATGGSGGTQPVGFGEGLQIGSKYAGTGGLIGTLVFSKVNFATGFAPPILPMMSEQVVRETFLYAGINGAFSGWSKAIFNTDDPGQWQDFAVNTSVTLVATGITVNTWHYIFANAPMEKQFNQYKLATAFVKPDKAGMDVRLKDAFRIPVSQKALVYTLPITIPGVQLAVLNPLMDWALGETQEGEKAPDGTYLKDPWYETAIRTSVPVANIAGQVGTAAALSSLYSAGSEHYGFGGASNPRTHWKRAPLRFTTTIDPDTGRVNPSVMQVMKTGYHDMGGFKGIFTAKETKIGVGRLGGGIIFLVGANMIINQQILGGQPVMPAGEKSLADGPEGMLANGAMATGMGMEGAAWLMAGGRVAMFMGPIGMVIGLIGLGASIALMAMDKARVSSRMEEPTREYLTKAGLDSGFANLVCDHDENGISSAARLIAYAKKRGEDPAELLERLQEIYLHQPDGEKLVDDFITATHFVEPNEDGAFAQDRKKDVDFNNWRELYEGTWAGWDSGESNVQHAMEKAIQQGGTAESRQKSVVDAHDLFGPDFGFDSGSVRATSIHGLDLWYKAFMPDQTELNAYIPANLKRDTKAVGGAFPETAPPGQAPGTPPGQTGGDPGKPTTPDPTKAPVGTQTPTEPPKEDPEPNVYEVQEGDYMWKIAGYDAKVYHSILKLNPIFKSSLTDTDANGPGGRDPSVLLPHKDKLILPPGYKPPKRNYSIAGQHH